MTCWPSPILSSIFRIFVLFCLAFFCDILLSLLYKLPASNGRLLRSRYLPRSSVYWQIIGLLRWPTSITVKVWGQYCAIEKTRSTLIFYWLVKMWASSLAFSWTKLGFGKPGKKKIVNLRQMFVSTMAKLCRHHGKTLKTPRQMFVHTTAKVRKGTVSSQFQYSIKYTKWVKLSCL